MYYLQELSLLLLFHQTRCIGILSIEKCLEQSYKIPLATQKKYQRQKIKQKLMKYKGNTGSNATGNMMNSGNSSQHLMSNKPVSTMILDAKVYTLDSSDDEHESGSDRDYLMEDDLLPKPLTNPTASSTSTSATATATVTASSIDDDDNDEDDNDPRYPWIIQLLAYDERHYRIKFPQKADYKKWQVLFATNSSLPFTNKPSSIHSSTSNTSNMMMGNNGNGLNGNNTNGGVGGNNNPNGMNNGGYNTMNTMNGNKMDEISSAECITFSAADISYDVEAGKKYSRLLRAQEKVIASGIILKYEKVMASSNATNAPKQRRILLVTDLPRMIFIDTIGSIVRGNLELSSGDKIEVKILDQTDFEVIVGGNNNRFSAVESEKDAKYWHAKIRLAINLKNI